VGGTTNVLEAIRELSTQSSCLESVVIITTDKCYENQDWVYAYRESDTLGGHDPYSASKACAELVVSSYRNSFFKDAKFGIATARAGNVIGGGDWAADRIIPDIVRSLQSDKPVFLRNPGMVRPWQHVLDPLSGYLLLGAQLANPETSRAFSTAWNFGPENSNNQSVEQVATCFLTAYGKQFWEIQRNNSTSTLKETGHLTLSSEKAKNLLGWKPTWPAEQAIAKTATWYKNFYKAEKADTLCSADLDEFEKAL
jgi:CDP-glucose 4,6-dehydratase